jgi:hypothetical protein
VQTLADRVAGNEANVVTAFEIILENTTDNHQLQYAVMKAQPALRQLLGATDPEIRCAWAVPGVPSHCAASSGRLSRDRSCSRISRSRRCHRVQGTSVLETPDDRGVERADELGA